jgi:hypothetical protein
VSGDAWEPREWPAWLVAVAIVCFTVVLVVAILVDGHS